jgi:hypothetical protein
MHKRSSRRRRNSHRSLRRRITLAIREAALRRTQNRWLLPAIGTALAVSVTAGLWLGQAAVSEIDPLAFRAAQPYSGRIAPPEPVPAVGLSRHWPGEEGCLPQCGPHAGDAFADLSAPPDYRPDIPYFGSGGDIGHAVDHARDELGPQFPETSLDLGVADGPIQRYSDFPVTQDERRRRLSEPADQPQP